MWVLCYRSSSQDLTRAKGSRRYMDSREGRWLEGAAKVERV